jgi:hypothetical protein
VETPGFEAVYRLKILNEKNTVYTRIDNQNVDDIEGLALWYLNTVPDERDMRVSFGYREDFNGVGLFLFKHKNQWRLQSILNQGLTGLTVETAVNNLSEYPSYLATPDNHCILYDFAGGEISVHFRVENGRLSVQYSVGGDAPSSCIENKAYGALRANGFIGVTAGNLAQQDVNDIDVLSVNFYNLNASFYQHDAAEVVEGQQYYARDENGFVGKKDYPWSAKLNTIAMEKVAYDVFEIKKNMREFNKELLAKALHVIQPQDDFGELMFKMFEQIRLLNEDLQTHLQVQQSKRQSIRNLERVLVHEADYQQILAKLKEQDKELYEISVLFAELTKEAKRILDSIKEKSEGRKRELGREEEQPQNHHRSLPEKVGGALEKASSDVSVAYSPGRQPPPLLRQIHPPNAERHFLSPRVPRASHRPPQAGLRVRQPGLVQQNPRHAGPKTHSRLRLQRPGPLSGLSAQRHRNQSQRKGRATGVSHQGEGLQGEVGFWPAHSVGPCERGLSLAQENAQWREEAGRIRRRATGRLCCRKFSHLKIF